LTLVGRLAQPRLSTPAPVVRQAAWYRKPHRTFIDALALVRRELWRHQAFQLSALTADVVKLPRGVLEHLTETLCYVA
jgi:hypothetical protein